MAPIVRSEPHEDWITDQVGEVISLISKGGSEISSESITEGVSLLHHAVMKEWRGNVDSWRTGRKLKAAQLRASEQAFHTVVATCLWFGLDLSKLLQGEMQFNDEIVKPPEQLRLSAQGWRRVFI